MPELSTHSDLGLTRPHTVQMLTPRNLNMLGKEVPAGVIQDWMWHEAAVADALAQHFPDGTATAFL